MPNRRPDQTAVPGRKFPRCGVRDVFAHGWEGTEGGGGCGGKGEGDGRGGEGVKGGWGWGGVGPCACAGVRAAVTRDENGRHKSERACDCVHG